MKSHSDKDNHQTLDEQILDEYAMGRLSPERREAVERHLAAVPALAARVKALREEGVKLRQALLSAGTAVPGNPIDDETLAMYLDRSLSTEMSRQVEARLAKCRTSQERLVAAYRELKSLSAAENQSIQSAGEEGPWNEDVPAQKAFEVLENVTLGETHPHKPSRAPVRMPSARVLAAACWATACAAAAAFLPEALTWPLLAGAVAAITYAVVEAQAGSIARESPMGWPLVQCTPGKRRTAWAVTAVLLYGLAFAYRPSSPWTLSGALVCHVIWLVVTFPLRVQRHSRLQPPSRQGDRPGPPYSDDIGRRESSGQT